MHYEVNLGRFALGKKLLMSEPTWVSLTPDLGEVCRRTAAYRVCSSQTKTFSSHAGIIARANGGRAKGANIVVLCS